MKIYMVRIDSRGDEMIHLTYNDIERAVDERQVNCKDVEIEEIEPKDGYRQYRIKEDAEPEESYINT